MSIPVYRLVKKKYASTAFSGEGAREYGGRWSSPGVPCVYLASSESLALLEVLVHIESAALLNSYTLFRLHLPSDQVKQHDLSRLPSDWRAPLSAGALSFGNAWLTQMKPELILAIPSAVVHRESNFMLNPAHENFDELVAQAVELELNPDPRIVDMTRSK